MKESSELPRLLIVVHHLAVDAVSWRILLDDLDVACRMRIAGDEVTFPPKSTSVGRSPWAFRKRSTSPMSRIVSAMSNDAT